ncbi:MFS general substrate transporter [Aulographum hederae CBS 113979]|uniref:MFS general substrate transporter n=1 Tax=Aulographum hederae CBS 113979 TaxID=1176131 RepID=A0A6G1GZV9_9PEZI|nr:MFS general substrate transporter [Aulographum hederae CBS 113979]
MVLRKVRSSKAFVIVVVCVAVFTDIFLYGLIVPMLPFALAERVGLSGNDIQRWNSILLASYGASILLGSLLFGWIGDQTKTRQLPFLLGVAVVGGATVLFSLATTLPVMLAARLLQGLSTAIVFTIGFSLLLDSVGKEQIGYAVGFTSMSLSLGLFSGPIVGGIVYDRAGYFAVFIPAFSLIGLEFVLRMLVTTPREETKRRESGEDGTTCEDEHIGDDDASDTPRRTPALLVLLGTPRFLVAMAGMFFLNAFMTAFEAVLPVYLRQVFNYHSTAVAIVFLSNTLPMIASPISGRLVDKYGPLWPAVAGFSLAAPSMMLLGLVQRNEPLLSALLRIFLFLFGCGVSLSMPAMMTEITLATEALEKERPGIFGQQGAHSQAYGLCNAAFAGGTLVGPLYAGYVRDALGWTAMSTTLGAFSILMVALVLIVGRHHIVRHVGTSTADEV